MSASSQRIRRGKTVLAIVSLALLLSSGVLGGRLVAQRLGLVSHFVRPSTVKALDEHGTRLEVGSRLSETLHLEDATGTVIPLDSLTAGRKTIVCIVSDGCGPCDQFLNQVTGDSVLPDGDYELVFLSPTPEYIIAATGLSAYPVSASFLTDQRIERFPTLVGLDEAGIIAFVAAGFSPALNAQFIMERL